MSRLPEITRDQLDAAQQAVWDSIASSGRSGVGGPFLPMLTSAELCSRVEQVGVFIRFQCSVPQRLRELAILCVGQHWKAGYEWFAHAHIALAKGVPQPVIDAIGQGQTPPFDDAADRIVHDFVRVLLREGRVPQPTYDAAIGLLGQKATVELTGLVGYYSLLAMQLNVFDIAPPVPFTAPWG